MYEEYEKFEEANYTVVYEGFLFEGDKEAGFNRVDFDKFEYALSLFNAYKLNTEIWIKDNYYGVDLHYDARSKEDYWY